MSLFSIIWVKMVIIWCVKLVSFFILCLVEKCMGWHVYLADMRNPFPLHLRHLIYTNVFKFSYLPFGPHMFLCFSLQFQCMLVDTFLFLYCPLSLWGIFNSMLSKESFWWLQLHRLQLNNWSSCNFG